MGENLFKFCVSFIHGFIHFTNISASIRPHPDSFQFGLNRKTSPTLIIAHEGALVAHQLRLPTKTFDALVDLAGLCPCLHELDVFVNHPYN